MEKYYITSEQKDEIFLGFELIKSAFEQKLSSQDISDQIFDLDALISDMKKQIFGTPVSDDYELIPSSEDDLSGGPS